MSTQGFQLIPPDIIEAWARGDYYVGDIPSISYSRLGTALFLRGWYTYQHVEEDKQRFAGVIKIEIKGPFLFMGGIRLYDSKSRQMVFWKSEASHFGSHDDVIWFYSVFNCDFVGEIAGLRTKYKIDSWLTESGDVSPDNYFGLSADNWNTFLDKLRTDFDSDVDQIQNSCTRAQIDDGMLRFNLLPDEKGRHLSRYYQFYSETGKERDLLTGSSFFRKTSKL